MPPRPPASEIHLCIQTPLSENPGSAPVYTVQCNNKLMFYHLKIRRYVGSNKTWAGFWTGLNSAL